MTKIIKVSDIKARFPEMTTDEIIEMFNERVKTTHQFHLNETTFGFPKNDNLIYNYLGYKRAQVGKYIVAHKEEFIKRGFTINVYEGVHKFYVEVRW